LAGIGYNKGEEGSQGPDGKTDRYHRASDIALGDVMNGLASKARDAGAFRYRLGIKAAMERSSSRSSKKAASAFDLNIEHAKEMADGWQCLPQTADKAQSQSVSAESAALDIPTGTCTEHRA
jgi:hypothetical protein